MKKMSAIKLILPLLVAGLMVTSCDIQESTVGSFGDVADKIPNFTVIPGAEDVTIEVNRNNNSSYFNVALSNVGQEAAILDGNYLGWCAHWSAPIGTSGEVYDGITLYTTENDNNWDKLNFLLNNRTRYMNTIEGVTYKEIQAVIWTLIEFKEFDVDNNRVLGEVNREAFDAVLADVRENGPGFQLVPGMIRAVFADVSVHKTQSENTQTVIIEQGETIWGGDSPGAGPAWWWYFDMEGPDTQNLYATAESIVAGTVTIVEENGSARITIEFGEGWGLDPSKGDEPVKIQGYNDSVPGFRPAAGPFTTYKGADLEVVVGLYEFYAIHIDGLLTTVVYL